MFKPEDIKGLLFDLGGVVINIDLERALQTWNQWTTLTIKEMRYRFKMDEVYEQHECGEIDATQYFNHLRKLLRLKADDAQIKSGWNAIINDEISETVDYIQAVKHRVPCFLFSNTNPTHQALWMSAFPNVIDSFDRVFVSSELGLRKPDPQSFEAVAKLVDIDLCNLLFFDDTLENIDAALAVGMHAIHVKSHRDIRLALQAADLLKADKN